MKTAREKAEDWIYSNIGSDTDEQIKYLTLLLKEQDRDTRHACAEAVLQCEEDMSGECIWKDDAHSACINVTAV